MLLSQTAEYALRAMAQLAALGPGAAIRTEDLAKMTSIPRSYLSKILRKLTAAGLLSSEKGHGGGFTMARPLKKIRFIDVLEAVEAPMDPNRCAFGWGECSAKHPCVLHPAFSQLKEAHQRWATRTTLADLVPSGE